jgi:hypothetical protein
MIEFTSPLWIAAILFPLIALVVWLSYKGNFAFTEAPKYLKWTMASLRALALALLALLLLNPVMPFEEIKLFPPKMALIVDNSLSISRETESLQQISNLPTQLKEAFPNVEWSFLTAGQDVKVGAEYNFDENQTDLAKALQFLQQNYGYDPSFKAAILVSDGWENRGNSALSMASQLGYSLHTLSVGELSQAVDIQITSVRHPKQVIQGNSFELEAVAKVENPIRAETTVRLFNSEGKEISSTKWKLNPEVSSQTFRFFPQIDVAGFERFRLEIDPIEGEEQIINNKKIFSVKAVESKKQIGLCFDSYHPDIAAIHRAILQFDSYEVRLIDMRKNQEYKSDFSALFMVHPSTVYSRQYNQILSQNPLAGIFYLAGDDQSASFLNELLARTIFQSGRGSEDNVRFQFNKSFSLFQRAESTDKLESSPSVSTPYGQWLLPQGSEIQMEQLLAGKPIQRPLLFHFNDKEERRWVVFTAKDFWRWRMNLFKKEGESTSFDDWLIEWSAYLTANRLDDRFSLNFPASLSWGQNFDLQAVLLDKTAAKSRSAKMKMTIKDPKENLLTLDLVELNGVYRIGFKPENIGEYSFDVEAKLGSEQFTQSGTFELSFDPLEFIESGANPALLQDLAESTNGIYKPIKEWEAFIQELKEIPLPSVQSSQIRFKEWIDWKWLFFILLSLLLGEWVIRRYLGSY